MALELVLRRKALGAEALSIQREAVLGGQYPALAPTLHHLHLLRVQIAQRTLAGPGPAGWPPPEASGSDPSPTALHPGAMIYRCPCLSRQMTFPG